MSRFKRQIEQHMARGDELMAGVREEMRLNREAAERHSEVLTRAMEAFDRGVEAFDRGVEAFDKTSRSIDRSLDRHERVTQTVLATLADMRDEIRAQTKAIFKVIDRLEGGASAA